MTSDTTQNHPESNSSSTGDVSKEQEQIDEIIHDIRNPLSIAEQYLALARDSHAQEHFDEIEDALTRINDIIDNRLDQETAFTRCVDTAVDVDAIVTDAWRSTPTGDNTLISRFSENPAPHIRIDPGHFKSLLENVFRNSHEHTDGPVTVRVGPLTDDHAELNNPGAPGFYIVDDGPGVSEAKRSEIFGKDYTTHPDGSGIGLHIVKQIITEYEWNVIVGEGKAGGLQLEFVLPESNWFPNGDPDFNQEGTSSSGDY